jgi:hypothetical protein
MPPPRKRRARKAKRSQFDRSQHDEHAGELGFFRVLAFDISSVACGWSVFEAGTLTDSGVYYQLGRDHGERLMHFGRFLGELFERIEPTHVAYEEPFQGRQKNAFGVLQFYIAVLLAAHFEYFEYEVPNANRITAREVKRLNNFPSGLTHAQNKALAVERVNLRYGLDLRYGGEHHKLDSDDDIADAILVNAAWHRREHPELLEVVA